ncbi:unnamed protein product [Peronospora belbahrii]|uniref:TATA element modulatory factor 1 TATA binding domain-containing protein n=1 Tax=Peronospora belbahrii TaxID=622444 RepID=A0ABN8CY05_9STRA|nr:unnamed protein product [Peronospora belbahrii]
MSSSSPWGGWGTKLNVTSIVTQGLEQVRSLREDVEKSFDQVVTGPTIARVTSSIDAKPLQQVEDKQLDNTEAIAVQDGVIATVKYNVSEDRDIDEASEEEIEAEMKENGKDLHEQNVIDESEQEVEKNERQESDEKDEEIVAEAVEEREEDVEEQLQDHEARKEEEAKVDGTLVDTDVNFDKSSREQGDQEQVIDAVGDDAEVVALQKKLEMRESQLVATSTTLRKLHDELDKMHHREIVAVERAQCLTEQLEDLRREIAELTQLRKDTSGNQSADMQALQIALEEKEEMLSALLGEGQALSVKQAQLEQRLRALRKEKDELEERAHKAESIVQVSGEEIKRILSKLKASEEEKMRLVQENRQLAGNADSMSARVETAEQKALEAAQQLEKLQDRMEELTFASAGKDEEIERLKLEAQSNEVLSHQNAELQEMLHFLQDNVRDLEKERSRHEEMARAEIADLKRKWRNAVARVDMLGQSVSEATQPLFRQIHALQEEQRARHDTWKATENTLVSRIEEATEQRRVVEQEKADMKQQLQELQHKVEEVELQIARIQVKLARSQDAADSAKAEVREWRGRAGALQIDFDQVKRQRDAHAEAKEQLQARLNNAEQSLRQLQASSSATAELEQSRELEAQLRQDLEWHQQELQRLKSLTGQLVPPPLSTDSASSQHHYARRMCGDEQLHGFEIANGELSSEASILLPMETAIMTDPLVSSGNTSVLELSQLQQRLRLREGENRMLKQQLETLEARQKQTTDEIVRLSTRNTLLESGETQRKETQLELAKLQKHQVVLLELFGEKEEQVEELQAEVKELKAFYRKQLDTLATHNEEQQRQRAEQQQ